MQKLGGFEFAIRDIQAGFIFSPIYSYLFVPEAGVLELDDPYIQLTPLSGVAVQACHASLQYVGWPLVSCPSYVAWRRAGWLLR